MFLLPIYEWLLSQLHLFMFIAQKAELLDFQTHSAFVLDMRMAKTPEKVRTFLRDLEKRLQALKQQEMDIFLQYKKEDVCPFAGYTFVC